MEDNKTAAVAATRDPLPDLADAAPAELRVRCCPYCGKDVELGFPENYKDGGPLLLWRCSIKHACVSRRQSCNEVYTVVGCDSPYGARLQLVQAWNHRAKSVMSLRIRRRGTR